MKIHSKRVEKIGQMKLEDMKKAMFQAQKEKEKSSDIVTIYLGETTLKTSGEDVKTHSKRVGKM